MRPFAAASLAAALVLAGFSAGCAPDLPAGASPGTIYSQVDLIVGAGTAATSTSTVGVNYIGWLYDSAQPGNIGAQFDASQTTFTFTLGTGSVIQGWEQGVPGMRVGGKRRLIIPPDLAYTNKRSQTIPPNATLIFDITMVSVQ